MKRKLLLVLVMSLAIYSAMAASLWAALYKYQDLSLQGLSLTRFGAHPEYLKAINDSEINGLLLDPQRRAKGPEPNGSEFAFWCHSSDCQCH